MANSYYVGTGVLVLDKVTPVITALFGDFHLDASYPGDGRAYIALSAERALPCWEDILLRLSRLGADLGILPSEAPDAETALSAWARQFDADQDEDEALQNLIEHYRFEDAAELDVLFLLATRFDDGHRLTAIEFEGGWYCSKPRLFEFGGHARFHSREVRLCDDSHRVLGFGSVLHLALSKSDLAGASELLTRTLSRLLDSIQDTPTRDTVRRLVIERLAE
jgi:hypothetical protein